MKDDMMVDVECGESMCETEGAENEACFPMYIPKYDPDFSNKTCLMFVRSQEVMRDDCSLGMHSFITIYSDSKNVV